MECEFNCSQKINLNVTDLDISTYDEYSARWRESKIKQEIKHLFEEGRASFSALELIEGLTKVIPEEATFMGIYPNYLENRTILLHVFLFPDMPNLIGKGKWMKIEGNELSSHLRGVIPGPNHEIIDDLYRSLYSGREKD
jgi:hypothetical protein